jgi:uncharacterized protein (DUF1015 family)
LRLIKKKRKKFMAEFTPFHGLRYNPEKVRLDDVLAPPYDVIKGAMREELLARSKYNVVEIELPEGEGDVKYDNAATIFKSWREREIFVQDDAAFYVYEQEFRVPGTGEILQRRGVLGALQLEEFGEGVQPHEHTLSGPKQDRLKLLRATRTNISPIFGLFGDNDGWAASLLQTICTESTPLLEARDGDGIIHRMWRLTDDETVNAIVGALDDEPVLIADGHHRYETALNYRNECAQKAGDTWAGSEPENFVMMLCVSMQDSGLVVLPTHRLVKNVSEETVAALPEKLTEVFEVEKVLGTTADLVGLVNEGETIRIGLIVPDAQYVLTLRDGAEQKALMDAERSEAFNNLDVTILHRLILERELQIDAEKLAAGQHVAYNISAEEAAQKVAGREYSVAFILRPTRVEQVRDCCAAGDKMPQKSTYFYPKLTTGLVLRPLD